MPSTSRVLHGLVMFALISASPVLRSEVIIGGSIGNGDFEDGEPSASGAVSYEQTTHWFNASGDETINFTRDNQTLGSSQPNSRAGMPFQDRVQVNDTPYTVTSAGVEISLTYDFGRVGTGWNGDEQMRAFLFTSETTVDGTLLAEDIVAVAEVLYPIPTAGFWTSFRRDSFYTTTDADIGKTLYFGMELLNPDQISVFPRIDVIKLETIEPVLAPEGWAQFINEFQLGGDPYHDTDSDGQIDIVEYVHGGNPTDPNNQGSTPSVTFDAAATITFTSIEPDHDNPGVPITAEWTTDLASGEWQGAWDSEQIFPANRPGYLVVERQLTANEHNALFFRVRIYEELAPVSRPNILVIMTDDLGYADVGFNGSPDIATPELDRLAANGTIFTSAYVPHPFCGPSRMGFFTGRYPHTFGAPFNLPGTNVGDFEEHGIPTDETLISRVLQASGYTTGLIGKWHLGVQPEHHPNQRGFDDFFGFLGGGKNYFGPYERQNASRSIWDYRTYPEHNGQDVTTLTSSDYITDVLSSEAIRFLNEASQQDQPFFLFLSYNAPHTPLQAKRSDLEVVSDLRGKRRTYAAMVYAVDRGVGEIVTSLKQNGQFKDTLIIFLSDNGGRTDEGASNRPLRGTKGDVLEGGFRVPMFMHLPGTVPSGAVFEHPITALDLYPTLAELAEATVPAGKILDGVSIVDHIRTDRNPRDGQSIYTVRYNIGSGPDGITNVGIRRNQWKALRFRGQNWMLYDVENDIGESNDLGETNPEILEAMVSDAREWSQSHITPLWYDSRRAERDWRTRGMPHYDRFFGLP